MGAARRGGKVDTKVGGAAVPYGRAGSGERAARSERGTGVRRAAAGAQRGSTLWPEPATIACSAATCAS
ncbi:hypothetical protein GCM10010106_33320 [Thermopolyspora flexuosa]|nr:hypothetical protein GCM10010106_33320 [Thermopolyspora flexuosa]